jgi:hypothetical protein
MRYTPQDGVVEHLLGQQLLELGVLVRECPPPTRVRHFQPAETRALHL